jgi:phosphoribosylamine--glycine ligase
MKILVVGTNTASDYISQKLLEDDRVEKIYHVGAHHTKFPSERYIPEKFKKDELLEYIRKNHKEIDLIIPTVLYFQLWSEFNSVVRNKQIPILMPNHKLGMLEWSKVTGKRLLTHLNIPTPPYRVLNKTELTNEFHSIKRPYVIKYEQDWRHGLQTIVITDDNVDKEYRDFVNAPESMYPATNNDEQATFLVEEFVKGVREYSWHAICNITGWRYLGTSRDYKKRYENDVGHNTASMGSYSPVPDVDAKINDYAQSIVDFLIRRGTPYVGILYLGIMIDEDGTPVVLEINTRPGSPEIESIIPTIKTNLLDIFHATATNAPIPEIEFNERSAVSIRIVNQTYSEEVVLSDLQFVMPKLWPLTGDVVMSMGNKANLLHSLLTVEDDNIDAAADQLYKFLKNKTMGNFTYRTDIGYFK